MAIHCSTAAPVTVRIKNWKLNRAKGQNPTLFYRWMLYIKNYNNSNDIWAFVSPRVQKERQPCSEIDHTLKERKRERQHRGTHPWVLRPNRYTERDLDVNEQTSVVVLLDSLRRISGETSNRETTCPLSNIWEWRFSRRPTLGKKNLPMFRMPPSQPQTSREKKSITKFWMRESSVTNAVNSAFSRGTIRSPNGVSPQTN